MLNHLQIIVARIVSHISQRAATVDGLHVLTSERFPKDMSIFYCLKRNFNMLNM